MSLPGTGHQGLPRFRGADKSADRLGPVRRAPYNRHPLAPAFALALGVIAAGLLALFLLGAVAYAYRRIGIGEGTLLGLIWLSLLGGFVNVPVARLRGRATLGLDEFVVFGVRYRVPVLRRPAPTILAVNVGGALIPAGLSVYLVIANGVWWQAAVGVLVVSAVVYRAAREVPGLGIAVPALLPPVLAALIALLVAPTATAAVAYASGSLGTLIGGDLLHLRRLSDLGAGVASIGGAGTFDGVFLSGIVAVVLVGLA